MKARTPITFEMFCLATQCLPIQDDLERSNCPKAGEIGHQCCGWNYQLNLPEFMGNGPFDPNWNGEWK